jgi:hypothetical protein
MGVVIMSTIFGLFWGDPNYRCRKCGRKTTIRYNTFRVPSTKEILAVPEKLAQKRYLGYWPDMTDIDAWLEPPAHPESGNKASGNTHP